VFAQLNSVEMTETTASAICGALSGHFVNYHTTQDPQGAIGEQLVRL
jgi:hypothetical protein